MSARAPRAALRLALLAVPVVALLPVALVSRGLVLAGHPALGTRLAAWAQRAWARASLRLAGVRLELDGRLPRGPVLVAANHVGYLDIAVLSALLPARFVAMHEISRWPLVGRLARVAGTIFIDRGRKRDVVDVSEGVEATLEAGVSVVLFPEGGAGDGTSLRPFRSPLLEVPARRGTPCVPVALGYATPGEAASPAWTVHWWGGMDLPRHLWRLLGLPRVVARVRLGDRPVVEADRKRLARRLHAAVAERLEPVELRPVPPDLPWPDLAPAPDAGDAGEGAFPPPGSSHAR